MMRGRLLWAILVILGAMIAPIGGEARARPFEEGMAAAQQGDFATALRIWEPLANRGHPNAQFNLGQMYARGDGVPQDFAKAIWWYRRVADQGFPEAQFRLGVLFERGFGVPTAPLCAYMWYNLAAGGGWQPAAGRRDSLATTMTAGQIRWAQKMAREFSSDYAFCPDTRDAAWIGF